MHVAAAGARRRASPAPPPAAAAPAPRARVPRPRQPRPPAGFSALKAHGRRAGARRAGFSAGRRPAPDRHFAPPPLRRRGALGASAARGAGLPAARRAGRGGIRRGAEGAAAALGGRFSCRLEQMAAALLLYLPLLPGLAGAFNLDAENVIGRRGEPGSLFGFSLAMHRQLQPQEKRL